MKKNLLVATLTAAALCSASAFAVNDGTINFTGEISANSCTVNMAGSTAQTVSLGSVSSSSFATGAGSSSSNTPFTISLTDCPAALRGVTAVFSGPTTGASNNLLAVSGGATGVGIQILDDTLAAVDVGASSKSYPVTNGAASMPFNARYFATATVVPGQANATTVFSLTYTQ